MTRVFIDSGHPSKLRDAGATHEYPDSALREVDLNLEVSYMLQDVLDALGVETTLAKKEPFEVLSLRRRHARARMSKADLVISVHHNSYRDHRAHGMRTFYNTNPHAETVAREILARAPAGLERRGRLPTPADARGWERVANVLRGYDDIPAVLVEVGYMSNASDRVLIQAKAVQEATALAIATGVARFRQLTHD